jgi:radical SAM superfamily enzyme YgiQ (UPF0313 family)
LPVLFRKIRKATFLLPGPYIYEDRCQTYIGRGSLFSYREPVEEMYAASILESFGVACEIIHASPAGMKRDDVLRRLSLFDPDAVIISTSFPSHVEDLGYVQPIRRLLQGAIIAARGGQMAHVDRANLMKRYSGLDAIISGETEKTLRRLFSDSTEDATPGLTCRIDGELVDRLPERSFDEPDDFLMPARHLLDHGLYRSPDGGRSMATVTVSHGCHMECIFCPAPAVSGGRIRCRGAESIVREIIECGNRYGIRDVFLRGDNLTFPRKWMLTLCGEIASKAPGVRWVCSARADCLDLELAKAMKDSGCWGIGIGAESGSQRTLERMKKGLTPERIREAVDACSAQGLVTMTYFMIGFPWESAGDIRNTVEFSKGLGSDFVEFFFPYPYPGTRLFEEARKSGIISVDNPPSRPQQEPVFIPSGVSRRELLSMRNSARLTAPLILRGIMAMVRTSAGTGRLLGTIKNGFKTLIKAGWRT